MPFTTYSGYVNEVLGFLQVTNADITTAQATSLIGVTERDVNQVLRVREMETAFSLNIASGGTAALPADYLELKNAYIDGTPIRRLQRASVDVIYEKFPDRTNAGTREERLIAREGNNFIFGPMGATDDVVKGIYYARPISMADGTTIQPAFSSYPQVYLWSALSKSEPYIWRDPRIATWERFFQQSLEIANGLKDREQLSGGALVEQLDTVTYSRQRT